MSIIGLIALLLIAAFSHPAAASIGQDASARPSSDRPGTEWMQDAATTSRAPLSTLRRLVRRFDFEEAELRPLEMPINFHRVIASDRGFPPFGDMRLVNDHAAQGRWSFRFQLDGGSMIARVPTAVIPVLPHADYAVTALVRTEGLTHAAARIVTVLYDQRGRPIPESRVESEPIRTNGRWQQVVVAIEGDFDHAADLVLELQVLQPRQYQTLPANTPALEDVHGQAWFDAVHVWHLPRIDLSTGKAGNILLQDEPKRLLAKVIDMASDPLSAELNVFDFDGKLVHHAFFDPPVEQTPQEIALPLQTCGWYRAVLDVHGRSGLVARRSLDFAIVPPVMASASHDSQLLLIDLSAHQSPAVLEHISAIMRRLGAAGAVLDPWMGLDDPPVMDLDHDPIPLAAHALLNENRLVIFALRSLPTNLARALGVDRHDVLEVLAQPVEHWRSSLEPLFIRFGLEVPQWLVSQSGRAELKTELAMIDAAQQALASYIPQPQILLLREASEQPHPRPHSGRTIGQVLQLPAAMRAAELATHIAAHGEGTHETMVKLPPAPGNYSQRDRIIDIAMRTLHAWRAEPQAIILPPPLRIGEDRRPELMPTEQFNVIRVLSEQLAMRRFIGALDIGPNLTCWMLQGDSARSSSLIVWADHRDTSPGSAAESATIEMILSDGSVRIVDLMGNQQEVSLRNDRHRIVLSDMPVFVEGIDINLARFRAAMQLNEPFIESAFRIHERELILHNPWPTTLTGRLTLQNGEHWEIRPRVHEFAIAPGQTWIQPVQITIAPNALAGTTTLRADATINADRRYDVQLEATLEIGLHNVALNGQWRLARDVHTGRPDLVLTLHVTNTGTTAVNLDAFIVATGLSQQRTAVGLLEPGRSAMRHFTIAGGADRLSGQTVRIGVAERDGPARLNMLMQLPELERMTSVAAVRDESH